MKYMQDYQVTSLLAPVDDTATAATAFVDVTKAAGPTIDFLLAIGAVTGDDVTLTIECCSASSTSGATTVAMPFSYRRSGVVGTDTWADVTTSDSAGITLAADSADSCTFIVTLDKHDVTAGYNYVRLVTTQGSSTSDFAAYAAAIGLPRYASYSPESSS